MNSSTLQPQDSLSPYESAVRALYQQLLDSWNSRDADNFAALFTEDGYSIGFDGSQLIGQGEIASTLHQIFADHPTVPYVSIVREVRLLNPNVAILRAIVGMVPPGQTNIEPAVNAIQTLVAQKREDIWRIVHFQNTPAQFHGRPELVQQMTEELQQLLE
jgi:uncharacterized protein (TIGR02246 family)